MPRREKHKIESNCVTFDDQCWDETNDVTKDTIAEDKDLVVSVTVSEDGEIQWPEHWTKQL